MDKDEKKKLNQEFQQKEQIERTANESIADEKLAVSEETESFKNILEASFNPLKENLIDLSETLSKVSSGVDKLIGQQALFPNKLLQLGRKMDEVIYSITETRIRDLLRSLIFLYDLIEQMLHSTKNNGEKESVDNYETLLTQIRQMLLVNGIETISTDIPFDPKLHNCVKSVECIDSSKDGTITEVIRRGFKTEQAVLRYADVVVAKYKTQNGKKIPFKKESDVESDNE